MVGSVRYVSLHLSLQLIIRLVNDSRPIESTQTRRDSERLIRYLHWPRQRSHRQRCAFVRTKQRAATNALGIRKNQVQTHRPTRIVWRFAADELNMFDVYTCVRCFGGRFYAHTFGTLAIITA